MSETKPLGTISGFSPPLGRAYDGIRRFRGLGGASLRMFNDRGTLRDAASRHRRLPPDARERRSGTGFFVLQH